MKAELVAPFPEKIEKVLELHGDKRTDPYYWLNQRENPKVKAYLEKENNYLEKSLESTKTVQEQFFKDLKSRVKEDDSSFPYRKAGYLYYYRFSKGEQYPVYCRKKNESSGQEEVLIDGPKEAGKDDYYSDTGPQISPNQEILAYGQDRIGRRFYNWKFKNLKTGKILPDVIKDATSNLVWASDNKTIFYTKQDPETLRSYQVYRLELGSQKAPELVYEEKDETFSTYVYTTSKHDFIFLLTSATLSSEVRFLRADQPRGGFTLFQKREPAHEYQVVEDDAKFYILSNWGAKNFKVFTTDFKKTDKSNWQELISGSDEIFISSLIVQKSFLGMEVRKNGQTEITISDKSGKNARDIKFEDEVYYAVIGVNEEYESDELRYNYQSMRQPASVFEYNVKSNRSAVRYTKDIPNYDSALYTTKRLWAPARDGKKIPISVLMRKDQKLDGSAPLFVYGYGSYGSSMDPWFETEIFSLINKGFVYAVPHVRGGGELGRWWTEEGRTLKKMNTFNDFVDATEFLIKEKYGHPKKVVAQGGSAGGLLMGVVINMRPELYKAVIAHVPFVDVVTTMLDASIPLTTGEYDEWGNPNDVKFYNYMKSYSPYDNVKKQAYPHVLATTGFHDSQVQYWEPAKWVPLLREYNTGPHQIFLKTNMEAGHAGKSGRYEALREVALDYAFYIWALEN